LDIFGRIWIGLALVEKVLKGSEWFGNFGIGLVGFCKVLIYLESFGEV
jgi:hypothetical protein